MDKLPEDTELCLFVGLAGEKIGSLIDILIKSSQEMLSGRLIVKTLSMQNSSGVWIGKSTTVSIKQVSLARNSSEELLFIDLMTFFCI